MTSKKPPINLKPLIVLAIISVAAIFIHGYSFSTGDQSTYVPQVLKRVNPNLFQNDYLSNTQEGSLSLLFPLMATIIKLFSIDIEWLYFVAYIFIHFLITFNIYRLSYQLTKNQFTSILATTFLILPKFIGGTNSTTIDTAFVPRYFVLPLLLTALNTIIQKRYLLSSFIIGIIFTLHPYSAVYIGLFLIGSLIASKNLSLFIKSAIAGLIPSSLFILLKAPQFLNSSGGSLIMADSWLSIVKARQPYNFLPNWKLSGWGSLLIPLTLADIFIVTSKFNKSSSKKLTQALTLSTIVAIIVTCIHYIAGETAQIALVLQFQLLRVWLVPVYLSYIAAANLAVNLLNKNSIALRVISGLICVGVVFNFGKIAHAKIEVPHQSEREWDQLQLWVKTHTPENSVIITPVTRTGFRIHSHRAIVGEIKDGSSGLYSHQLANNWQQRINDLGLLIKTEAEIINLKTKYHADYLVTFIPQNYSSFEKIHQTKTFIVYKL